MKSLETIDREINERAGDGRSDNPDLDVAARAIARQIMISNELSKTQNKRNIFSRSNKGTVATSVIASVVLEACSSDSNTVNQTAQVAEATPTVDIYKRLTDQPLPLIPNRPVVLARPTKESQVLQANGEDIAIIPAVRGLTRETNFKQAGDPDGCEAEGFVKYTQTSKVYGNFLNKNHVKLVSLGEKGPAGKILGDMGMDSMQMLYRLPGTDNYSSEIMKLSDHTDLAKRLIDKNEPFVVVNQVLDTGEVEKSAMRCDCLNPVVPPAKNVNIYVQPKIIILPPPIIIQEATPTLVVPTPRIYVLPTPTEHIPAPQMEYICLDGVPNTLRTVQESYNYAVERGYLNRPPVMERMTVEEYLNLACLPKPTEVPPIPHVPAQPQLEAICDNGRPNTLVEVQRVYGIARERGYENRPDFLRWMTPEQYLDLACRPQVPPPPPFFPPNYPTPYFPTPYFPTPYFPTPYFPTPYFPTPNFPTPNIPTPFPTPPNTITPPIFPTPPSTPTAPRNTIVPQTELPTSTVGVGPTQTKETVSTVRPTSSPDRTVVIPPTVPTVELPTVRPQTALPSSTIGFAPIQTKEPVSTARPTSTQARSIVAPATVQSAPTPRPTVRPAVSSADSNANHLNVAPHVDQQAAPTARANNRSVDSVPHINAAPSVNRQPTPRTNRKISLEEAQSDSEYQTLVGDNITTQSEHGNGGIDPLVTGIFALGVTAALAYRRFRPFIRK